MATEKTASLILRGYLSVGDAETVKADIKEALATKLSKITIDVSHLEDIDVSIIQLLYALYKEADKKIEITFLGAISALVKRNLYICGLISDEDVSDAVVVEAFERTVRSVL